MTHDRPRRIAVVGSGVAGLTAAYVASRTAHVTLFEADDRLGGHADTHLVADGADRELRHRHRLHRPQPSAPTRCCCGCSPSSASPPRPSEMSMSVSDDGTGLEWAGALGARGLFPTAGQPARPALPGGCSPRSRASTAGAPGGSLADTGDADRDAARVPRRRPLHAVLRAPLHGAAGRRRLVVRPGGRARLPRALPVHVPRAPRHARRLRLAAVAHRHRRLAGTTSPRRPRRCHEVRTGTKVTSVLETAAASRSPTATATSRRTTPSWSPPTRPRRWRCSPTPTAAPARGARRDALLAQHRAAAHRHLAAAAAPTAPGRRGTSARPVDDHRRA